MNYLSKSATFLLLLPLAARADDLTGTWKEIRRADPSGRNVSFADTIRVEFKVGNQYLWMRPNTFQYRGTYTVNEKTLDLGTRTFDILSRQSSRLLLRDDNGSLELARYEEQAPTEDNSAASNGNRAKKEIAATSIKNIAQLTGNWEVYKRTNGGEKVAIDYSRILRRIVVSGNDKAGELYSAEDMQGKPSWTIERLADNTLYCKGRDARMLKVVSCGPAELILQEGSVTYFFKQFKG